MEIIIICVLLNILSILPEYPLADIKVFDFPFNALISVFMCFLTHPIQTPLKWRVTLSMRLYFHILIIEVMMRNHGVAASP